MHPGATRLEAILRARELEDRSFETGLNIIVAVVVMSRCVDALLAIGAAAPIRWRNLGGVLLPRRQRL
eukprot:4193997-Pyramimonas_sp.AAC.1